VRIHLDPSRRKCPIRSLVLGLLASMSAVIVTPSLSAQDLLAQRIAHTDLDKFAASSSHGGAGARINQQLLDSNSLGVNLNFLIRGRLLPGGGIGHHFHNSCEEMQLILNGEAEFTIDGRTALIKGPAGAPCRMGHSHALYNPTDKPVEYLNINVGAFKGHCDSFDLGDSRIGVPKDPIPVFMSARLDGSDLKPVAGLHGGTGTVQYRRLFGPDVFLTNWAYVDYLAIPAGASEGKHWHRGVEEVYYVLSGSGRVAVGDETVDIQAGDAVPVRLYEVHSFSSLGPGDLQLMIFGISTQKNALDTQVGLPDAPTWLQVSPKKED
jgi:mannose-6-phosphate isomerase-like protein (cupin superfamily)